MPIPRLDRGDVWKSKARSLQLQLRDRFRVAVDRHWRRRHNHPFIPAADVYFSSTIQRWLTRFRDFRRESLPSSTSFYRKRGAWLINALTINLYIYFLEYCVGFKLNIR